MLSEYSVAYWYSKAKELEAELAAARDENQRRDEDIALLVAAYYGNVSSETRELAEAAARLHAALAAAEEQDG